MATAGLLQDERFRNHLTGADHPERPERLARIASVLEQQGITKACTALNASPIDMTLVRRLHTEEYLTRLEKACADGSDHIDEAESAICPESFEIAKLAVGGVVHAVDEVMGGRVDNAFCAVRPPGHHAERHMAMGFCLLGNVAIAAQHLIDDHGLSRVLIVDWDVHHGNGTQHAFETDPRVLFISIHGHPDIVYPGTGPEQERGRGEGEGFTINIPMLPPAGDGEYRTAFDEIILPEVQRYAPEFVLISAGFDAHRLDPLAPLNLETESYGWMTDDLLHVAKEHCQGRLVSVLEGGYDLDALSDSVALHVTRLLDA